MLSQEITVTDEIGFHARTAAIFAKAAGKFKSTVSLTFNNKKVNGKSMLGIMTLGVKNADMIDITVEGEDEKLALEHMTALVESNFDLQK